ncbi:SDR family NAD(P)-dependent oxidoreductase [Novosphingobium cyanobacteriorum]|uniref:SDR family NAD(P)-dependent oxidoreductase n=1 Tax=Novosphingobium cyanobacteriorum TaxID=3024215 RepID=A0ABT6CKS6_9SPHN|nr:SDR family NAD(P)-dependent oxidoreductase [Novosphingobium cyanobacteriorum]MDF8334163.1 SDR family NAD(P)-dependent oxidoreductase [Novosphingobium cyanobacteriorum]
METPRYSLAGRIALITGASSGLGAHFARLYASAGAAVVIGARRVDRLSGLVAEIEASGGRALAVALDVTDEASIIAAFDAAEAQLGTPDVVVANAGIVEAGRSVELPADAMRRVVDTNFNGVYLTAREGARRMIAAGSKESEKGRIILTGSITAQMTAQGDSAYAATKLAVQHLGRQFAREWARLGINVNVIQPGYIRTEIDGEWFDTDGGKAQIAGWPRKRLTEIEALDDMMLFFASDASRQVTGTFISVDDGQSL